VNLRGTVPATVQLENGRHFAARLHQLSKTGGVLELTSCLDERAKIRLTLPFDSGTPCPTAEMYFPMRSLRGYLQPFRFTQVSEDDGQILDREISKHLQQGDTAAKPVPRLGLQPPSSFLDSL